MRFPFLVLDANLVEGFIVITEFQDNRHSKSIRLSTQQGKLAKMITSTCLTKYVYSEFNAPITRNNNIKTLI